MLSGMKRRVKPIPAPPRPEKTYPCAHCGEMTWRAFALRSAGYCEKCEWMTVSEAERATLMSRRHILIYRLNGKWLSVRIGGHVLIHRADVDQTIAQREQNGRGWVGLTRIAA